MENGAHYGKAAKPGGLVNGVFTMKGAEEVHDALS